MRFRIAIAALLLLPNPVRGAPVASSPPETDLTAVLARIEAQEAEIAELQDRLAAYEAGVLAPATAEQSLGCTNRLEGDALPWATATPQALGPAAYEAVAEVDPAAAAAETGPEVRYVADYDNGFLLRPVDPARDPFELKVGGWIQFRYHAFSRDIVAWTDNAGVVRPVENRSAFDIERGRLLFSGFALDERLTYFLQLDGDTDGSETVDFFDYYWAWEFSDRFQIQLGKRKVPGSRQWLLSARNTRLVDRPMACDFFRPDRTTGIFAVGRFGELDRFELMAGNGYRTANLPLSAIDDKLTFAATWYVDPLGDYGNPLEDLEGSPAPRARVGHSLTYSPQTSDNQGVPLGESDFVRLADGTRLTDPGALTPGVTVTDFDLFLYSIDGGWKYRGWSMNAEAYLRWLQGIAGDGPLTVQKIFQRGFFVEGGRFLVPRKLDVNVRYSQVSGLVGNSSEIAAGLSWRPLDTPRLRFSFDVADLDGSPLQNSGSDVLAGDDGTLYRAQMQAEF